MKEAIGKDLSRITMPIFLNEPVSMLQKTAEMMHYFDILKKGQTFSDGLKRLAYVAVWVLV